MYENLPSAERIRRLRGASITPVDRIELPGWIDPANAEAEADRLTKSPRPPVTVPTLQASDASTEQQTLDRGRERMRLIAEEQESRQKETFDRRGRVQRESEAGFADWQTDQARIAQELQDSRRAEAEKAIDDTLERDVDRAGHIPTPDPAVWDERFPGPTTIREMALDGMPEISAPMEAAPEDSPLPGEERLPPEVAAWNRARTERGIGGGLSGLHKAYLAEVPEDQRSQMPFEYWLEEKKGIKPGMDNLRPALNSIAPMPQDHVDRRKDQFINTIMKRHAAELTRAGVTRAQLASVYDAGVSADKSGDPILAGSRAVNRAFVGNMKDARDQQIALNVQKRADQQNRARDFGVRPGTVQFFDSLQAARTPQERANVLALAHAAQPQMGWDKMSAMVMRGEIDQQALSQWAQAMGGKPNPLAQIGQNAHDIANTPLGPELIAKAEAEAARANPGAKPAALKGHVANQALPAIRAHVASGKPWGIPEVTAASRVLSTEPADFAFQLGLPANDPRVPQLYQQIHGTPIPGTWVGWFGNAGNAASQWWGNMVRSQAQANGGAAAAPLNPGVPPDGA